MKVPVASKKKKIFQTIPTVFVWAVAIWFIACYAKVVFGEGLIFTIMWLAMAVALTVFNCITLFSYVVIDESGITLKRGIIKVNHIAWEQVLRVEIFKALHRRSVFFSDTYVRISTTEEESFAYEHKISPLNADVESISFVYNTQADDLIKQYYQGEIYR